MLLGLAIGLFVGGLVGAFAVSLMVIAGDRRAQPPSRLVFDGQRFRKLRDDREREC
jgi:hypothetical protein